MVKIGDYEIKESLYFSKDYLWVKVEGGRARCGLTDYAQKKLTHLVYVDIPQAGTEITQNEVCGSIESTKAVSDLIAPLSGKVVEHNVALESEAGLVNQDPYGKGWIFVIDPSNLEAELTNLMDFDKAVVWHKELQK